MCCEQCEGPFPLLFGLADKVGIGICRYRQIFADKISLFREACYLLFGYKVRATYNLLLLSCVLIESLYGSLITCTLSCIFISSHSRLEVLEDYNDLIIYYLSIVFKAVLHALVVHTMCTLA